MCTFFLIELVYIYRMPRVRVVWREEEEERLLQLLTSLVDVEHMRGRRLEPMHLTQLHNEMQVSFPERGIGVNCIYAKIRYWKRDFARIHEMLTFAGFGWDADENKIIVEEEVWDHFVQVSSSKLLLILI